MKIACSSATFAREIRDGELTQLDWLDACANELEVDGVVFDVAHFPRTDADYLAQVKKAAVDLGLTVAAVAAGDAIFGEKASDEPSPIDVAVTIGAPLVATFAPHASDDASAWGAFANGLSSLARAAKSANVTLALGTKARTLCTDAAALRRAAKDVDSAWVRFAFDGSAAADAEDARILAKSVIARIEIERLDAFATPADEAARAAIERFARFRGFVVLDASSDRAPAAYHDAVARFATLRAAALEAGALVFER